jgi:hypothetical protein
MARATMGKVSARSAANASGGDKYALRREGWRLTAAIARSDPDSKVEANRKGTGTIDKQSNNRRAAKKVENHAFIGRNCGSCAGAGSEAAWTLQEKAPLGGAF